MNTATKYFRILINKILIMFIWIIILMCLCGLSIIPVSYFYILYAISCVIVVGGGCWFCHLLDETNIRLRNRS